MVEGIGGRMGRSYGRYSRVRYKVIQVNGGPSTKWFEDARRSQSAEVFLMSEEVSRRTPYRRYRNTCFRQVDATVVCNDPGLALYVNLTTVGATHTGGRHANMWSKVQPVVERYINKLCEQGLTPVRTIRNEGVRKRSGCSRRATHIHSKSSSMRLQCERWKKSHELSSVLFSAKGGRLTISTTRCCTEEPRKGCSARHTQVQEPPTMHRQ